MKLLTRKSGRAEPEADEAALADRLRSIAGRGRDETALYPARKAPTAPAAPRVKRLFWTPDELD